MVLVTRLYLIHINSQINRIHMELCFIDKTTVLFMPN